MQLKVPPGGLAFLSALWALLGAYLSYSSFARGDSFLGVAGLIFCVAGILIWLDVRAVAWPLMLWFGVAILGAILIISTKGFALRPFVGILVAGDTIYELYRWRKPSIDRYDDEQT